MWQPDTATKPKTCTLKPIYKAINQGPNNITQPTKTQHNNTHMMKASKVLLGLLLCIMVSLGASHSSRGPGMRTTTRARQCRIEQLSTSQPNDRIKFEGGEVERWDEEEEQFQCAGVSAMRITVQPNSLSLPMYESSPRLFYVEQGEGVLGISLPGCPETYESRAMQMRGEEDEREESGRQLRDSHQPTRRIRKGDIVAIPHGTVNWKFNDGDEDLILVAVNNLNTDANQLDQTLRTFFLAGGLSEGSKQTRGRQVNMQNIMKAFDPELLAEAMGTREQTIRQVQESDERGFIVKAKEMRQMMTPPRVGREDEESYEEEREYKRRSTRGECRKRGGCRRESDDDDYSKNGLEESFCNMRFRYNIDTRREADIYSREAGRINVVNQNKLPILEFLDMSAEKGHLSPNALYAPHWSIDGHSVVYVTRGEAQMQMVDNNGQTVMDDKIREGDMFVIPQFFLSTCRAGRDGLEYVSFKTSANPTRSLLNGHASVFTAMPAPVISKSYQISSSDAQELKQSRRQEHALFSPFGRRS